MKLNVVRTQRDEQSIREIAATIGADNLDAAFRFVAAVESACRFLGDFPDSGDEVGTRKKNLKGLRVWQVHEFPNYLVLFRKITDAVEVLLVFHGARDLGNALRELS